MLEIRGKSSVTDYESSLVRVEARQDRRPGQVGRAPGRVRVWTRGGFAQLARCQYEGELAVVIIASEVVRSYKLKDPIFFWVGTCVRRVASVEASRRRRQPIAIESGTRQE